MPAVLRSVAAVSSLLLPLLLAAGCGGGGDEPPATSIVLLRASGGRVAWYKGAAATHERIAFDAIVDEATQNTETFTMNPDGSDVVCVTCGAHPTLPAGFVGQPEWHPDGQHLVIQAENANSLHTRFNHLAWGIDQDLWVVGMDGSGPEKIFDNAAFPHRAALHPHFDASGTRLLFSQRIATGVVIPALVGSTPGGENPWAGWQLHLAAYDAAGTGTGKLSSHVAVFGSGAPAERGFYESHGFHGDRIVYSATAGGAAFVDDCFTANLDGSGVVNLTNGPTTWEEHATYSPSGNAFVFISSRADASWAAPGDNASTLRTELYLQRGSDVQQITHFNRDGDPAKRYLTSDFEWDRAGRRLVVQVAPVDAITGVADHPQIWMITFPEPQ